MLWMLADLPSRCCWPAAGQWDDQEGRAALYLAAALIKGLGFGDIPVLNVWLTYLQVR